MNAGSVPFRLTSSSVYHLLAGGTRLAAGKAISILRVVLLVDVSHWQGLIEFLTMLLAGVKGVIVKCGQGMAQDSYFQTNWARARSAGLPRGTYWFYDSRVDPKVQAKNWAEWLKGETGELMHFLDLEENYGGTWKGWKNWKICLAEFMRLSGLPPSRVGIYTGYFYWIANSPILSTDLNWFAQFSLWLAWYTDNPANVIIPKPWTQLVLWQYGTPANGQKYGAESLEIDENNFNGDEQAYREFFKLDPAPLPEPNGDAMLYGKVLVTLNIRPTPSTQYGPIGQLQANDLVEAVIDIGGWWKLAKITRAGQNVPLPAVDCYAFEGETNGYIQPIPAPATIKHVIRIYTDGSYSIDDLPIVP